MNGVLRTEEWFTQRQATLKVISLRLAKKVGEEEESVIESENGAKDTIFALNVSTQCCFRYRLT